MTVGLGYEGRGFFQGARLKECGQRSDFGGGLQKQLGELPGLLVWSRRAVHGGGAQGGDSLVLSPAMPSGLEWCWAHEGRMTTVC